MSGTSAVNDTRKPVKRRTVEAYRKRRIVVTLGPGDVIGLREERTRRTFTYPITSIYEYVVARTVMAERAAKRRKV